MARSLTVNQQLVERVEIARYERLQAYRLWKNEPSRLRWLRFGCGNFLAVEDDVLVETRVANTKELPGLDGTDGIMPNGGKTQSKEMPVLTGCFVGAGGGNRTHTPRRERDFESRASASFTTPA